jgi:hypothetical protein
MGRRVMNLGSNSLINDLKKLELTRFLGGSTLGQLGMIYAQAGVWLRMAQIESDEAGFREALRIAREDRARRCQFDAYPDEDVEALNVLRPESVRTARPRRSTTLGLHWQSRVEPSIPGRARLRPTASACANSDEEGEECRAAIAFAWPQSHAR